MDFITIRLHATTPRRRSLRGNERSHSSIRTFARECQGIPDFAARKPGVCCARIANGDGYASETWSPAGRNYRRAHWLCCCRAVLQQLRFPCVTRRTLYSKPPWPGAGSRAARSVGAHVSTEPRLVRHLFI